MERKQLKERLKQHLEHLAIDRDPYGSSGGHFFVREHIKEKLQSYGKVEIHEFEYRGKKHQNILLNLPGSEPKEQLLIIGAHYDGVFGTPGADDNATGVAAMLELAAILAKEPLKYPVQLVAFDLEEYGLIGSIAYAEYLKKLKQPLRLMLSLEMLGYCDRAPNSQTYPPVIESLYPNTGDFIAVVGNQASIGDLKRLKDQMLKIGQACELLMVPGDGKLIMATRASDHAPFWDAGYRAIMVTDTAFLRNPHYHRPSDTIETLDLDFFTNVFIGLVKGLRTL